MNNNADHRYYLRISAPQSLISNLKDVLFQDICNRIHETIPQFIHGDNHTDETECEQWPCNNIYTRCDQFWHCPNVEDEVNCTSSFHCPEYTFECVSALNWTIMCLPAEKVADGVMDCLGGTDEQNICRYNMLEGRSHPGFHDRQCLSSGVLCDG